MNQSLDIRWRQRFEHFGMILDQLSDAHTKTVNTMITVEIAGWIHIFDLTFELAWKTLRDYMIEQQETERMDFTREVLEVALMRGLIDDGDIWLQMLVDRNSSTHEYNESLARGLVQKIQTTYHTALQKCYDSLSLRIT